MHTTISSQSALRSKILAWYQILGGAAGIILTFWLLARTGEINGLLMILFMVAFALFSFSIYAGKILLNKNYVQGLLLTKVNQAMQILNFAMLGYAYKYVAGAMFIIKMSVSNGLNFGFNFSLVSTWQLSFNTQDRYFEIGINLIAIYLVYFADKLDTTIKNELRSPITIPTDDAFTNNIVGATPIATSDKL